MKISLGAAGTRGADCVQTALSHSLFTDGRPIRGGFTSSVNSFLHFVNYENMLRFHQFIFTLFNNPSSSLLPIYFPKLLGDQWVLLCDLSQVCCQEKRVMDSTEDNHPIEHQFTEVCHDVGQILSQFLGSSSSLLTHAVINQRLIDHLMDLQGSKSPQDSHRILPNYDHGINISSLSLITTFFVETINHLSKS